MELCRGRRIGKGYSPFIIAEIGQNHQVDIKFLSLFLSLGEEGWINSRMIDIDHFQPSLLIWEIFVASLSLFLSL